MPLLPCLAPITLMKIHNGADYLINKPTWPIRPGFGQRNVLPFNDDQSGHKCPDDYDMWSVSHGSLSKKILEIKQKKFWACPSLKKTRVGLSAP